jgi:tetratricopeptide (TPR) repeat protein
MANLGYVHYEQKRYAEAEPLLRRALEIRRRVLPAGSAELGHSLLLLGRFLVVTGHPREAEPLLREVGALWRRTYSSGNLRTADADSVLGSCLTALGRYDEAERLLRTSYASITAGGAADSNLGTTTRARLAELYEAWRKPDLAAEWRNKPVPARDDRQP